MAYIKKQPLSIPYGVHRYGMSGAMEPMQIPAGTIAYRPDRQSSLRPLMGLGDDCSASYGGTTQPDGTCSVPIIGTQTTFPGAGTTVSTVTGTGPASSSSGGGFASSLLSGLTSFFGGQQTAAQQQAALLAAQQNQGISPTTMIVLGGGALLLLAMMMKSRNAE